LSPTGFKGGFLRRAVFLDRDNTLIHDPGFIHEPEKVRLLEGVVEGLKLLKEAGFLPVVISNQSGIGRGYFTEREFWAVNARLNELLAPHGVQIEDFFFCPHRPDENCDCRKPSPRLVFEAARKWGIDISESFVIGDRDSDLMLAFNAGCRGGLIVGREPFKTFLDAARFIVGGGDEALLSDKDKA
jgi:D-glycero-D-manno-heptose 1,7-bisphosphate phosphatase